MNIETLVKANANHVRVTQLSEGDVYKRLSETYGRPELKLGVVTGILSNGDTTVVTALEFDDSYTSSERVKEYVMKSGENVAIFPATPEEIEVVTDRITDRAKDDVANARQALERKQDQQRRIADLMDRIGSGALSTPAFEALEDSNG